MVVTREQAIGERVNREIALRRAKRRDENWSPKGEADTYERYRSPNAFTDATDASIMGLPFSDELISLIGAPFRATGDWISGRDFDLGRAYDEKMQVEEELRKRRETRSPAASILGSVLGGLAVGGPAAKGGWSLLASAKPTLASLTGRGAAEGAAWGTIYGAGEGRGVDERLKNAASGTVGGAILGALLGSLGGIGATKADEISSAADESLVAALHRRAAGEIDNRAQPKAIEDGVTEPVGKSADIDPPRQAPSDPAQVKAGAAETQRLSWSALDGSLGGTGTPKVSGAETASGERLANLNSNWLGMQPFPKEKRAFELDYPGDVPADKSGKLLRDIDGRPFNADARFVAGRRVVGGRDAVPGAHAPGRIAEEATGERIIYDWLPDGELGRTVFDPLTGDPKYVVVDSSLSRAQRRETAAHEAGHLVISKVNGLDDLPVYGFEDDLRRNYSTGADGKIPDKDLISPEDFGYPAWDVPHELWAEAIRGYLRSPSYFKNRYPELASVLREAVNSHPFFRNLLQLNSLAGAVATPAMLNYLVGQRSEKKRDGPSDQRL